ncbi:MAG: alginate lyase family protein [Emcibacteraceae bacterium]
MVNVKMASMLYFYTLRHLKLIQLINRFTRRLFSVKVDASSAPSYQISSPYGHKIIKKHRVFIPGSNYNILNLTKKLSFPEGWNDHNIPKLWLYNLHYFDGLLNDETPNSLKQTLINLWIEQNPPGKGNGWEPYPISLRIVNWIKWNLSGNKLYDQAIQSLAIQTRYLIGTLEFHLLGNHLFANAKALIFSGLFFEGKEADNWYQQGYRILQEQIPEQFLKDGAHFELSTTYHATLTEDLLDIIQLLKLNNMEIPTTWQLAAKNAVQWLIYMTRPDGNPPLFNDAAYGISPKLDELLIVYHSMGLGEVSNLETGMTDLPESGYFRFEGENYSFFGDAGQIGPDYIPGHAHCDMLNFELFAHGIPIIVDTGTSTYELGERRNLERSTVSHNTVQIDNFEQSEIWGAFRVARRARIIKREVNNYNVSAEYFIYKSKKIRHKREFYFDKGFVKLIDKVQNSNIATARIHFHPNILVSIEENVINAGPIKIEFEGDISINIKEYEYAPKFNNLIPAKVLEITFIKQLTTKISI